jgi:hypothetical protein
MAYPQNLRLSACQMYGENGTVQVSVSTSGGRLGGSTQLTLSPHTGGGLLPAVYFLTTACRAVISLMFPQLLFLQGKKEI